MDILISLDTGTYIHGVIGKLISELYKNENCTDISGDQIFTKIAWLNYQLNLYKEITIGFKHGLQMSLKFLASLSDSFLV